MSATGRKLSCEGSNLRNRFYLLRVTRRSLPLPNRPCLARVATPISLARQHRVVFPLWLTKVYIQNFRAGPCRTSRGLKRTTLSNSPGCVAVYLATLHDHYLLVLGIRLSPCSQFLIRYHKFPLSLPSYIRSFQHLSSPVLALCIDHPGTQKATTTRLTRPAPRDEIAYTVTAN